MSEKTKLELFKEMVGTKLADIKQLFEVPVIEPAPVAEFVDVKTKDGVVIRISGKTPEVGGKCVIIDEKGETPAPDAEYTLEDGTVIKTAGGMIAEVSGGEKTEEPAQMEEDMNKEIEGVKESIKSITYKYAEIEKALAAKIEADKVEFAKVIKDNETLKAQNKAMFSVIDAIAGLPVDEPTETPKHTTGTGRLAEFREEVRLMKAERKKLRD